MNLVAGEPCRATRSLRNSPGTDLPPATMRIRLRSAHGDDARARAGYGEDTPHARSWRLPHVIEPLSAATLGGLVYDKAQSAIAKWVTAQLSIRVEVTLRDRVLRQGRPAKDQQTELASVIKAAVDLTATELFPGEERLQGRFHNALLDSPTQDWPLVNGSDLTYITKDVHEWILSNDPLPGAHPGNEDPKAHPYLAILCRTIIAQFGFRAENNGAKNIFLHPRWNRFWSTELFNGRQEIRRAKEGAAAVERHISNDFGPIDTVIQGQSIAVNHFQIELTIEPARDRNLAPASNRANVWEGSPEDAGALDRSLAKHERQARSLKPAIGLIDRPEIEEALAILRRAESPQVVIVDGDAGAGKSAVVTALASSLAGQDWVVAFTRMDGSEPVSNAASVGAQMGLSGSPAVVLAGVAASRDGLLVIDQLDAVSELSGRVPESFEAVDEILEEVRDYPNIKVLLACRTVDLNRDPRLRSLMHGDNSAAKRVHLGLLDPDRIRTQLSEYGLHVPSGAVVELLRTPLHLAVYCRLEPEAQEAPYRTLADLYEQLTTEVCARLERRVNTSVDLETITTPLVEYMNEHEVLAAPPACLQPVPPKIIEALKSEKILVAKGGGLGFFHETYFDHLFARSFIRDGRDLHQFLVESQQALFKRAQTRQILAYLAGTNRPAYRKQVARILESEGIRFHLKDIIITGLRELDATSEDWLAIEHLSWGPLPEAARIRTLLQSPVWFDAVDSLGRWERWLAAPDRLDEVFTSLGLAAKDRGERAAALVQPFLTAEEGWAQRCFSMLRWSIGPGLVDLMIAMINQGHFDQDEQHHPQSEFWSLLYGLKHEDAAGAARLIGAFLNRSLTKAYEQGASDPFDSGHLAMDPHSAGVIEGIAANAPGTFLTEVLPFITTVATTEQRRPENQLPYGSRWKPLYGPDPYDIDDHLFTAAEKALISVTAHAPGEATAALQQLREAESHELRFLACRALTEAGDPDDAIKWLLSDPRNLQLGWIHDPHWAAAHLIKAHSPHCSPELLGNLEQAVLHSSSPFEIRRGHGFGQYILLNALDRSRVGERTHRRLGELARKFPHDLPSNPRWIHEDEDQEAVPADKLMRDEDWLRAFRKHYDPENDSYLGRGPGRARLFVELLERRASEEPERFAHLALRFDNTIPVAAITHVIRGLSDQDDLDLFADVCEHAIAVYGDAVGWALPSAIDDLDTANSRIIDLIEWCASSSDPAPGSSPFTSSTEFGSIDSTGRLLETGFNTVRGRAAITARGMLFKAPDQVNRLARIIGKLARDPHLAVRACAAEAVNSLSTTHSELAVDFAAALFLAPPEILDAYTSERLLASALAKAPSRFAGPLAQALSGPHAIAGRAGRVWAFAARHSAIAPPLTTNVQSLSPSARIGAAQLFSRNPPTSIPWLTTLFNDNEPTVRTRASIAMRELNEVSPPDLDLLTAAFVSSPAFGEHLGHLMYGLVKLGQRLPTATLDACAKAVGIAGSDLGNLQTAHAGAARDIITVILRLYHQSSAAEDRSQILDIIDGLCKSNAYGIAEALAEER